jgi:hypothetical protein
MRREDEDFRDEDREPAAPSGGNWWEDPSSRPPGYGGPWPPPLPPGASYGPIPGQVIMAPGTRSSDLPGWTDPGAPGVDWDDPSQNPTYNPNYNNQPPPANTGASPSGGAQSNFPQPPGSFVAPTPTSLGGPAGVPNTPSFSPPQFRTPPPFAYRTFQAPSVQDALNDPGYQFRTQQGQDALQNWAAARGTLNDSSTAKALQDYGQQAASSEYQNVWNRDFNAWNTGFSNDLSAYATNYGTQYADPYRASYQSYLDTVVNPAMTAYSTQAAANQHNNDMAYSNAWNMYLEDEDKYRDRRNTALDWSTR